MAGNVNVLCVPEGGEHRVWYTPEYRGLYGGGWGTSPDSSGGKRPSSFAMSPPLATVTSPALAQGTSTFHCCITARCSLIAQ